MKVAAIIQARMGSSRLPGKVLRNVAGRPLLAHVLERVLVCKRLDQIIVAAPDTPEDVAVLALADTCGVISFAGSPDDVLDRYYQAVRAYPAEVIVRLTADCPLLDPTEIDRAVLHFMAHAELDYLGMGRTYPEGYGTEIFRFEVLERAWREATLPSEREHVTAYIWRHPERFRVAWLEYPVDLSRFRVTVDEEADLSVVSAIVEALDPVMPVCGIDAVVTFLQAHPEIASLNSHIARQAGYWKSVGRDSANANVTAHSSRRTQTS